VRKKQQMEKTLELFRRREAYFKERRNQYFKKGVRNIGKTKDEIKKEESKALEGKRMIKLGGGFEAA